jgi:hypothetical protein
MPCASTTLLTFVGVDDQRVAIADFDEPELLRAVDVVSGDLAQVIDALGKGLATVSGVRVVEVGVGAAAIEEAVRPAAGGIDVVADHLPRGVDAICQCACKCAGGGLGIIEGGVGKD